MEFLVDTTFLIGLWRRGSKGKEAVFIQKHPDSSVGIPWIVKAEFLRGAVIAGHPASPIKSFLDRYQVLWPAEETLMVYARTYSMLRQQNRMIGSHNLWIASAGLQLGLPLLTTNVEEFRRVSDLKVVDYSN